MKKENSKHLLIHIPHSSLVIPRICKKRLIKNIHDENIFMSDYLIDKIANTNYQSLKFNYSRMFCDIERFNSKTEEMNKYGMGVVYCKDSNNEKFIDYDDKYKNKIINKYYNKYHNKLDNLVSSIIKKYNKCLIVDLHSFSDEFVKKVLNKENTPDICIGIEEKYTSKQLIKLTIKHFKKYNYSIKINYPYSGSIIPNKYINQYDNRINTIMLEINKRIYLTDNNKVNKEKFIKLKKCINEYFSLIKNI